MLSFLTQSAWTDRIGWALVHSLWQFALVAMAAILVQRALARRSAAARYRALLAAMAIMAAAPVATWFAPWSDDPPTAEIAFRSIDYAEVASPSRPIPAPQYGDSATAMAGSVAGPERNDGRGESQVSEAMFFAEPPGPATQSTTTGWTASWSLTARHIRPWLPEIVLAWFAGVLLAAFRLLLSWRTVHRLRTAGVSPVDSAVHGVFEQMAGRLKLTSAIELLESTLIRTPVVLGCIRPVVLLPACMATGLPVVQLEAILAHELAHIRRHDYLVNLLQAVIETLFFYHPAVWWLSRQIRIERENCCDDVAVATVESRADYGRALLAIEELRAASTALSLSARGGSLLARIRRIAGCEPVPRVAGGASILCAVLVSLAILAAVTWASAPSAAEPQSESTATTAEAFGKLSEAEQRAALVRAFQQRLELGRNLLYETEQVYRAYDSSNWEPGKPHRRYPSYFRYVRRYWRLGDSYKVETYRYDDPKAVDSSGYSANAENAQEGVGRNASISTREGETHRQGQVVYPYQPTIDERFHTYPSPDDTMVTPGGQQHFFEYLVDKKDKFDITSPVSGDKVQLAVPWHSNKQVFILDPQKDYLPVGFDAGWETPATKDRKGRWYKVRFEVQESRLCGTVWMPVKMVTRSLSSENVLTIVETKVLRIESGNVKPTDLLLPFTDGMHVADVIEGVTYTADAKGNAADLKDAPNWKHDPPKGWRQGQVEEACSLVSRIPAAERTRLVAEREAKSKPIDEGLKILRARSPATQEERIEAALKILRAYRIGEREDDWAVAIRELITIGKPAVPTLIEELDRTDSDKTLRAMGFVLRGIGDPRAAPALIRAIPRLIQRGGDFGLTIKNDPELLKFMWMHDHDHLGKNQERVEANGLTHFSYGRPIREIMPALEKLTGQSFEWRALGFADMKAEGVTQLRRQRTLFLEHARKWADWWSQNWKNHVPAEADAQLDRTKKSLDQFAEAIARMPQPPAPTEIPCGPRVKVGEGTSYDQFEPYLNLDVARQIPSPEELLKKSPKDRPSPELLAWAAQNGVDLLCIEIKRPGDSKTYYGYQPVGMKVWKIDNKRLANLAEELRKSKRLDLPPLWQGPISSVDQREGDMADEKAAAFLVITREGTCGTIQIRSGLLHPFVQGAPAMGPPVFEVHRIYESEPENAPSKPAASPRVAHPKRSDGRGEVRLNSATPFAEPQRLCEGRGDPKRRLTTPIAPLWACHQTAWNQCRTSR